MMMTAVATKMAAAKGATTKGATTKGAAAMQGVAATERRTAKGATTPMQSMTPEGGAAKAMPTAKRNTSEADGVAMQGAMHRRV